MLQIVTNFLDFGLKIQNQTRITSMSSSELSEVINSLRKSSSSSPSMKPLPVYNYFQKNKADSRKYHYSPEPWRPVWIPSKPLLKKFKIRDQMSMQALLSCLSKSMAMNEKNKLENIADTGSIRKNLVVTLGSLCLHFLPGKTALIIKLK